ncbi:WD40 repeat domain-containing protein [Diaphorobacter sp. HDW4A]|uniref:WD40 repeat domain-containing protein n=1 Tax=Diaphorobacter sp. HDW4A TaxID=2714924 RepID=UPI001407FDA2|nr:WD40 repeat domain-containing protein [Diaphorobacter sp. HDW4A]QIL80916.1 WD40 repeat domain-containing protein [Diaphorobacter sp. HDW4A]
MSPATASSQQWKTAVHAYAKHLNDYIARGDAKGWKGMGDPKDPPELEALLPDMMSALRAANAERSDEAITAFREQWPPMHEATQPLLQDNSQGIGSLAWLANGGLMVRTGAWYEPGSAVMIHGLQVTDMPDAEMFGNSPAQLTTAVAGNGVICIVKNDDGSIAAKFDLPTGNEDLPPGHPSAEHDDKNADNSDKTEIQQLIPFDDASGVVVVQSAGIFLVAASGTKRLLPEAEDLAENMLEKEPYLVRLDMCHAAVSPDGQWIVCGAQDGRHRVFNARGDLVDRIGPHGEYPHHTAFFADGRHAAMNACHFYNGGTIAVDVSAFGGIDSEFYDEHPAVKLIDGSARVYASAPVGDSLVLGDANGYLWVRNAKGELQWKQHVGSTICSMAVSVDETRLAVGTYSGTVHIIDLTDSQTAPEQVGAGARRELRRWLFWKQETTPLAW